MFRKVLLCAVVLVMAASNAFAYSDADKVFSVSHSDLGSNGSVIATWGSFTKTGATGYDPTVQTLTDPVTSQSIKWANPAAGTLNTSGGTTAGGSGFTTGVIDGIANTGFTIVTAVIPSTNTLGSGDYRSIINAYLGGLGLYQMDNGKVCLRLQTAYNAYNTFITSSAVLTDGQRTVLSLVVSNTGVYELWRDVISGGTTYSTLILSGTSANWPSGMLLPSVSPTGTTTTSRNSIGLGSAGGLNTGVTTTTFRGYIGDTYLYKTALTSAERTALVNSVETSMGMLAGTSTYSISGRVQDPGGNGISGATVYFKTSANASVNPNFTTTTDSSGNYTMTGLSSGTWYVAAAKSGYTPNPTADTSVNLTANTTGINFVLTASTGATLVDINVSSIAGSDGTAISSWSNAGTLGGTFGLDGTDQTTRPVIATVQGKRCVQFDGSNDRLKLLNGSTAIGAPSAITGNSDWSVAGWYLNPAIASTESYLCWASNAETVPGRCSFGYGSHNGDGAVMHGVGTINYNMPFIPVPAANQWHHLAVTFDGTTEKVYSDGILNQSEAKTLAITAGQPFLLGCLYATPTGGSQGTRYSGCIASLTVYDQALTATDISNLATYAVSGTVTGPTGAPLAGAVVGFKNTAKTTAGLAISATADADVYATTNSSGNYTVRLLKDCSYYGAAWKDGYSPSADVLVTADAPKTVNLSITADAGYNLAAGRTTGADTLWASATGLGANPVNYACDGNTSTYMSWNTSSQKDFVLDITKSNGTADTINGITIITSSYRQYDWELWVESDADPIVSSTRNTSATWTKVYQSVGARGGYDRTAVNGQVVDPVKLPTTSARGIWIKVINGSSSDTRPLEVMVHSSAAAVSLATAKAQADGTAVYVTGSSVTYAPKNASGTRTGSYFYIEDATKTTGIRVENPSGSLDALKVNNSVAVLGTMATISATGERYINAQFVPVGTTSAGLTPDTATTSTIQSNSALAGKFVAVQDVVQQVASDGSWFTFGTNNTKVYVSGVQLPTNFATVGATIKAIGAVGKEYSGGVKSVIWLFNYENVTGTSDEFTFYCVSDIHYGADSTSDPANRAVIDMMNALPGTAYPAALGGNVQTPKGVIEIGDIAEGGTDPQFNIFDADYGINAECRLRYPVFEGLGNHDGRIDATIANRIKARTPFRRNLTGVSVNGMHYSWDWGSVHFVHLNRIPSDVTESNPSNALVGDPCYALEFLQQDLATNVGFSGRPVFIVHHYGFEEFSSGWWSQNERSAYYNAISGYNIVGIGHGHKHSIGKYQWDGTTYAPTLPNGIDIFQDSSGYNKEGLCPGGFYVIRIRNNQLAWAQRWYNPSTAQWEWGTTGTKTIVTP